MPVLASAVIPIRVNEDHTIEIILQEIQKSGCSCTSELASELKEPLDSVKEAARTLSRAGIIVCDEKDTVCCVDKEKLDEFVRKLKAVRGG